MVRSSKILNEKAGRTWRMGCGLVGLVTLACCAGQSGSVAKGGACPASLRDVQVTAEQRPEDVLVRITAPAGSDPEALMNDAPLIADALMREDRAATGPSQQTRPAPGREVRISRLPDGVEMSFASNALLGLRGMRKRITDRVTRWQKGECPSLERTLSRPEVAQTSTSQAQSSEQPVADSQTP